MVTNSLPVFFTSMTASVPKHIKPLMCLDITFFTLQIQYIYLFLWDKVGN